MTKYKKGDYIKATYGDGAIIGEVIDHSPNGTIWYKPLVGVSGYYSGYIYKLDDQYGLPEGKATRFSAYNTPLWKVMNE